MIHFGKYFHIFMLGVSNQNKERKNQDTEWEAVSEVGGVDQVFTTGKYTAILVSDVNLSWR